MRCVILALLLAATPAFAQRTPVFLDTDLGTDLDDSFTLALILASPELELRGVTTSGSDPEIRALMACRFLTMTGRRHFSVAAGAKEQVKRPIAPNGMYRYYYHPDVLFNRTTRPVKESATEFLNAKLKSAAKPVAFLANGPLTNLARLLKERPLAKEAIDRVYITEENLAHDAEAAKFVQTTGIATSVLPMPLTQKMTLSADRLRRVFAPSTALSLQVQAIHELAGQPDPRLAETLLAAALVQSSLIHWKGPDSAKIAAKIDEAGFLDWFTARMENCVRPESRPAKLVPTGPFPTRVHVAEDYETDIERFWWMAGLDEKKNLPTLGKRACRGSLTHDFDDLLGHTKAMYSAVIFNPVPGPPMSGNTKLAFRYYLKGTDTIRVQIYSLTNGYHRQLVLKNLPQGSWQSACVDMTQMRRPDGTGGPLGKDERIDDLQWYVEPQAELIIDDMVLFEPGPANETRPFPKRIHFTATFDTGTREKHWPGSLKLIEKGHFWRAATTEDKGPLIVGMRGSRPLGATTSVAFQYRSSDTDRRIVIELFHRDVKVATTSLGMMPKDEWHRAHATFEARDLKAADEIRFFIPGTDLQVDDVILYEPAEK